MRKLYRSLLWSGLVVAGVAACGDDVTVAPPPPPPAPTVHSISVAPNGVNVAPGSATTMVASVNADATVATTVTWSLPGVPASTASISAAGVLTVAAAAPNGPIAVQACSTAVPSVCGNATLTVSSVAATVTVVTVTPGPSIGFIVGQTPVTFTASVQGANNPAQTVTWSTASGTAAVISVNAVSGVVTIIAPGTDVVKACSTVPGFTNVCGSSSVTVAAPAPTNITLLGITQGGTTIPVPLSGVSGQVDVQLNVDPGAGTINKVQLLIGGV
ncbi:MAG TPA: hypothetical protein VFU23_10365, partial [Gemmatimonadales bacterium]|nr:hypothetical protein [Gemmatimonadales bacterium]